MISTAASTPVKATAASRPTTALTVSTAPNRIAVDALRRTLTATLVAVLADVTYFATLMACSPLADCFFSWRTPERAAPPLPSCRAMSTRIQFFLGKRLLPCFLARPPASQSVLHCCTLQVRLTPSSGLFAVTYSSGPIPPPNSSNRVPRNI